MESISRYWCMMLCMPRGIPEIYIFGKFIMHCNSIHCDDTAEVSQSLISTKTSHFKGSRYELVTLFDRQWDSINSFLARLDLESPSAAPVTTPHSNGNQSVSRMITLHEILWKTWHAFKLLCLARLGLSGTRNSDQGYQCPRTLQH